VTTAAQRHGATLLDHYASLDAVAVGAHTGAAVALYAAVEALPSADHERAIVAALALAERRGREAERECAHLEALHATRGAIDRVQRVLGDWAARLNVADFGGV
jgi:hypothetical protein